MGISNGPTNHSLAQEKKDKHEMFGGLIYTDPSIFEIWVILPARVTSKKQIVKKR